MSKPAAKEPFESEIKRRLDAGTVNRLEKLAEDVGYEWQGEPSIPLLMKAVSRVDAMVLEEILADADASPEQIIRGGHR